MKFGIQVGDTKLHLFISPVYYQLYIHREIWGKPQLFLWKYLFTKSSKSYLIEMAFFWNTDLILLCNLSIELKNNKFLVIFNKILPQNVMWQFCLIDHYLLKKGWGRMGVGNFTIRAAFIFKKGAMI